MFNRQKDELNLIIEIHFHLFAITFQIKSASVDLFLTT